MRKLILIIIFVLSLSFSVWAITEFHKLLSVTGGSAQRMSTVLTTGGYTGSFQLDELTICNPSDAANVLYIGQSDVDNTNGFPLVQGDCMSEHASTQQPRDPTQIYIYTATTQNVNFEVVGR